MGIGGIFLAFGITIMLISVFAHQGDWRIWLPGMMTVGPGSLVVESRCSYLAGCCIAPDGRARRPDPRQTFLMVRDAVSQVTAAFLK